MALRAAYRAAPMKGRSSMKLITRAADLFMSRMVPTVSAEACVAPDCYYQRCCHRCDGSVYCS